MKETEEIFRQKAEAEEGEEEEREGETKEGEQLDVTFSDHGDILNKEKINTSIRNLRYY